MLGKNGGLWRASPSTDTRAKSTNLGNFTIIGHRAIFKHPVIVIA